MHSSSDIKLFTCVFPKVSTGSQFLKGSSTKQGDGKENKTVSRKTRHN